MDKYEWLKENFYQKKTRRKVALGPLSTRTCGSSDWLMFGLKYSLPDGLDSKQSWSKEDLYGPESHLLSRGCIFLKPYGLFTFAPHPPQLVWDMGV